MLLLQRSIEASVLLEGCVDKLLISHFAQPVLSAADWVQCQVQGSWGERDVTLPLSSLVGTSEV